MNIGKDWINISEKLQDGSLDRNAISEFVNQIVAQVKISAPNKLKSCLHSNGKVVAKHFLKKDENQLSVLHTEKQRDRYSCQIGCEKDGIKQSKCAIYHLVIPKALQYDSESEEFFGRIESLVGNVLSKEDNFFQKESGSFNPEIKLIIYAYLAINFFRSEVIMKNVVIPSGKPQIDFFGEAMEILIQSMGNKSMFVFKTDVPLILPNGHVLVNAKNISESNSPSKDERSRKKRMKFTSILSSNFIYAPLKRNLGVVIFSPDFEQHQFIQTIRKYDFCSTLNYVTKESILSLIALNKEYDDGRRKEWNNISPVDYLALEMNRLVAKNTLFDELYGFGIREPEVIKEIWDNRRK